jgi:hypothetical protein
MYHQTQAQNTGHTENNTKYTHKFQFTLASFPVIAEYEARRTQAKNSAHGRQTFVRASPIVVGAFSIIFTAVAITGQSSARQSVTCAPIAPEFVDADILTGAVTVAQEALVYILKCTNIQNIKKYVAGHIQCFFGKICTLEF